MKASDTDDSDTLPVEKLDRRLPATMKSMTVLGEVSSGSTALPSRTGATDPDLRERLEARLADL